MMFKRLYISTVIRNMVILNVLLSTVNLYSVTMIYRVPNQQKEKILNQILVSGSDSVLDNPIFDEYKYFYLDVNDNAEILKVSGQDAEDGERERYIEYIIRRYFENDIDDSIFNVKPEDQCFDHLSFGSYYYSAKLVEFGETGLRRIMILYTKENAGYFFESMQKLNSLNMLLIPLVCVISLFFAFWETRPAKRACAEQRDFFENASHELRTPITIISSSLEHVKDTICTQSLSNIQNQWLDILSNETDKMRLIVNDLMFLARADAKHIKLEKKDVRLDVIMLETYISMEVLAMEKGVAFSEFKCDEMVVFGDSEKLCQLMSILLKNAVENTPAGETVSLSGHNEKNTVVISVMDTGKGIAKRDIKKIFRRFYRADPYANSGGNSGLGLSIANWIVRLHKGKIIVNSNPGEGSTFHIKLPKKRK